MVAVLAGEAPTVDIVVAVTAGLGVDADMDVETDEVGDGDALDNVGFLEDGGNVAMAESAADLCLCLCFGEACGRGLTTEGMGCCCCCGKCADACALVCCVRATTGSACA